VLCGTSGGDVYIFDLQSGQLHAQLAVVGRGEVAHVTFRSDSRQVAFIGDRVELWDLDTRSRVWTSDVQNCVRVVFSPQNDLLACLVRYYCVLVDAVSGEEVVRWKTRHSSQYQNDVAWGADETRLLTSDDEGMVYVWDIASARSSQDINRLYHCDTSQRTTSCSFFDNHGSILTDHGIFPIPTEHRPPCATGDTQPPSQETVLRLRDDGWIWCIRAGAGDRRVCWLPPAYRPVKPIFHKNLAIARDTMMLVTDSGRAVVLNFGKWF